MHLNFMVCNDAGNTLQECLIHRAWAIDIIQPMIGQYGVLFEGETSAKVRKLFSIVESAWLDRNEETIEFQLPHQAEFYSALSMQVVIFSTQARNSIDKVIAENPNHATRIRTDMLGNAHRRLGFTCDLLRLLVLSMQNEYRFIVESVREQPKQ